MVYEWSFSEFFLVTLMKPIPEVEIILGRIRADLNLNTWICDRSVHYCEFVGSLQCNGHKMMVTVTHKCSSNYKCFKELFNRRC